MGGSRTLGVATWIARTPHLDTRDGRETTNCVTPNPIIIVLHHQVLVEEAERLLRRGRGQADQVGVEVFQHLAPEVVNGPVALVGEDDVERLDRYSMICKPRGRAR